MKKVDIRFNTNFPSKSQFEWRVLIEGVETLVNNVRIETPCYTTSTFIEGHGMKWHISTEANTVEFSNSYSNNKQATIK
jgi:uridine kinase